MGSGASPRPALQYVQVSVDEQRNVGHLTLAREGKSNALNMQMWVRANPIGNPGPLLSLSALKPKTHVGPARRVS
jgi:hypothetical protein